MLKAWSRFVLIFLCVFCGNAFSLSYAKSHPKTPAPFYKRTDVNQFINQMVKDYHFKRRYLIDLFKQVHPTGEVIQRITHPYEEEPWYVYREHFLTKDRVDQGVKFWKKHRKTLERAQAKYGVPASMIVAIIGIESRYGKRQGHYRVMDALSSLAFNYSPRAPFFQKELREFLLLCREKHLNPLKVYGSYAGAIGQPQFMPSSFRHYAVDFSGTGVIDLTSDEVDVIGSVANYFYLNGWQQGQPIAVQAIMRKYHWPLPTYSREPNLTIKQLRHYNIVPKTVQLKPDVSVTFLALQDKSKYDYWLGLYNFYVITRYNTHFRYAMTAFLLSRELEKAYHAKK